MDFSYTEAEEAFRQEFRSWLAANLPPEHDPEDISWLYRDDSTWEKQLRWHKELHRGGWIGIHWPREYGGRGATLIEQFIFDEEMERARVPRGVNLLGVMMAGPVIMHWGTEEQKRRFLRPILSADEIWCEGLSEPGAGSDLGALQTRAVEDGDDFVVTGQKVWTSFAHRADWCQLFVRTDPEAPKHRGISCLLVDMRSPGITTRPLVQITGNAEFSEVFFDGVRVPRANLVGPKNQGWNVLMTTLMFERAGLGADMPVEAVLKQLAALARRVEIDGRPASENPLVRQRLAGFATEAQALRLNILRNLTRRLRGQPPGPEGSIGKLVASDLGMRMAMFATELLGPYAPLLPGSPCARARGRWALAALAARAMTIAGGTSEVQRNIIGQYVLGLPR